MMRESKIYVSNDGKIRRSLKKNRRRNRVSNKYIMKMKTKTRFICNKFKDSIAFTDEIEREYDKYKRRKKTSNRNSGRGCFYNSDGSFNSVGILLGMFSDDSDVRYKSIRLFVVNMDAIFCSDDFADLVGLLFSVSVFAYLYCLFFFNYSNFVGHVFL